MEIFIVVMVFKGIIDAVEAYSTIEGAHATRAAFLTSVGIDPEDDASVEAHAQDGTECTIWGTHVEYWHEERD